MIETWKTSKRSWSLFTFITAISLCSLKRNLTEKNAGCKIRVIKKEERMYTVPKVINNHINYPLLYIPIRFQHSEATKGGGGGGEKIEKEYKRDHQDFPKAIPWTKPLCTAAKMTVLFT